MSQQCQKKDHDLQRIKYFCIDKRCTKKDKLGCADCFLEDHYLHEKITTHQLKQRCSDALNISNIQPIKLNLDISEQQEEIVGRLAHLRTTYKSQLNSQLGQIHQQQQNLKVELNKSIKSYTNQAQTPLHVMSDKRLRQLLNLPKNIQKQKEVYNTNKMELANEKQSLMKRSEKYVTKMNNVVNNLLQDLRVDDTIRDDYTDVYDLEESRFSIMNSNQVTPQKPQQQYKKPNLTNRRYLSFNQERKVFNNKKQKVN